MNINLARLIGPPGNACLQKGLEELRNRVTTSKRIERPDQ